MASVLFYGREHLVLAADMEENDSAGLDNTMDSLASSEMMLFSPKPRGKLCAWLSLRVVLILTAVLHAIALLWVCIGIFWRVILPDMQCTHEVEQV